MKRFSLAILLIFLVLNLYAGESIKELEKKLQRSSGKEKVSLLLKLADLTAHHPDDQCLDYCKQAIDLSKHIGDPGSHARALQVMNTVYQARGDKEVSLKCLHEALRIYEELSDDQGTATCLQSIGIHYMNIQYYGIAQDYLLRASKIWQISGNEDKLYFVHLSLGELEYNLKNYSKAMEKFDVAMQHARNLKSEKLILPVLFYKGLCCRKQGRYQDALSFLQRTRSLADKLKNRQYKAKAMTFTGDVYSQRGRHQAALSVLSQAMTILNTLNDSSTLAYHFYFTGNAYLAMKNYLKARLAFNKAIDLAAELDDNQLLESVYMSCSQLFERTGDFKQAFQYYQLFTETSEKIFNENKAKQIAQLQIQFEAEKRQKEIEILTRDNEIQAITRNTSILVLLLVIIILGLVFKKYLYLMAFWKKHKYIGQYRLIDKIGSGGMGTVYLAHPVNDKNQRVAVKVLREELLEDPNSRRRFKNEGMVIDKLEHPNIVKTIERGEAEGKLYIVMEYLDARTLAQEIKHNGALELKKALEIMIQMAGALSFIHEKKIVHRDIKPANVMLTADKDGGLKIKLLDFGLALAEFQTRLTQSGILVGTINYTAPEQITENNYSAASDVYSLGVTYYEIITGQPPFPSPSVTTVIERILDTHPERPDTIRSGLPPELTGLIMKMLDKSPSERPSAADVLEQLSIFF